MCTHMHTLQRSPDSVHSRNMASDTMLHCAIKAQPTNTVSSSRSFCHLCLSTQTPPLFVPILKPNIPPPSHIFYFPRSFEIYKFWLVVCVYVCVCIFWWCWGQNMETWHIHTGIAENADWLRRGCLGERRWSVDLWGYAYFSPTPGLHILLLLGRQYCIYSVDMRLHTSVLDLFSLFLPVLSLLTYCTYTLSCRPLLLPAQALVEYSKSLTHNQKEVAVPNLEKEPSAVHLRKEPSAAHPSNVPFPWLRKVCVHICAYERERERQRGGFVVGWLGVRVRAWYACDHSKTQQLQDTVCVFTYCYARPALTIT